MPIKVIDFSKLMHQSNNIYEIVVAMARRAKEINEQQRAELEEKIAPFKAKTRNPTKRSRS